MSSIRFQNIDQTISQQISCNREAPLHSQNTRRGCISPFRTSTDPISTLASVPPTNSNVSLGIQADSSETQSRFEAHVPQIAFAQFHYHFSFVCLQTKPTGHTHSRSLSPHSHKREEGKSKAELRPPGQEVRASGFSDLLAHLREGRLSTGHLLQPGPEEGTSGLVTLCISWQTGWTNVGLGEDEAQEMGSYWVPIYSDSVATKATPASLAGVKGKAEAARRLWRELTSLGLSEDRAPLLQAKSNAP